MQPISTISQNNKRPHQQRNLSRASMYQNIDWGIENWFKCHSLSPRVCILTVNSQPFREKCICFNTSYLKGWMHFVTDITSQSALRCWRSQFSGPVPYIVLGSVATLLAILGPFGTGDLISSVNAFFYWLVIVMGTYSIGFLTNIELAAKLPSA